VNHTQMAKNAHAQTAAARLREARNRINGMDGFPPMAAPVGTARRAGCQNTVILGVWPASGHVPGRRSLSSISARFIHLPLPILPMALRPRLTALITALLLARCATQARTEPLPDGLRADVAVLETTDLHSNILSYDYYKQKADPTLGFERTVTLIRKAREQFTNSLLFDAGDTIQGSVLADYQAQVQKVDCGEELAIYKAMDAVGYDGGT